MTRRSVLLLCDNNPNHADTVLDHIRALHSLSQHEVYIFNPRGLREVRALSLDEFDCIVIHYSLICTSDKYLPARLRERISQFKGLKVQFLQDEYRWVDRICAMVRALGVNVLLSSLPVDEMARIYERRLPGVRLEHTLTGYVPARLVGLDVPDVARRTTDIGYRGRELPFWLGQLGQQKLEIAIGVEQRADAFGLVTDIGWREADRIYGRAWTRFLASCRSTLGTASGASIIDTDGRIEAEVESYLSKHPGADFKAVQSTVLWKYEDNVHFEVVSPRIFEAAALRTALILFPGSYSGILEPDRQYIPLDRNFANFASVARKLRDDTGLRELTSRAYEDLIASGRYSEAGFVAGFDKIVEGGTTGKVAWTPKLSFRAAKIHSMVSRDHGPLVPRLLAYTHRTRANWLADGIESLPVVGRLVRDPGVFTTKGIWALRMMITNNVFRRVLVAWLTDAHVRSAVSFDVLLEEGLELIVAGRLALQPMEAFSVDVCHDPASGVLRLVSTSTPQSAAGQRFEDALASGVESIEWDHRAFGGRLQVGFASVDESRDLHIGENGLEKSALLTVLLTERTHLVRALVGPLLTNTPKSSRQTLA
jgi:hypothetical protein